MVITLPLVATTAGPGERRLSWAMIFSVLLHVVAVWYFVSRLIVSPVMEEPSPVVAVIQPVPKLTPPPPPPQIKADPPKPTPLKPRPVAVPPEHAQVPPLPVPPQPAGPVEPTAQIPTETETVPAPAPTPTKRAKVIYPRRALDQEIEGIATVQVSVGQGGAVTSAQVVGESPQGYGFGDAALQSVQQWQFADAAPGAYTVTVKFALN